MNLCLFNIPALEFGHAENARNMENPPELKNSVNVKGAGGATMCDAVIEKAEAKLKDIGYDPNHRLKKLYNK